MELTPDGSYIDDWRDEGGTLVWTKALIISKYIAECFIRETHQISISEDMQIANKYFYVLVGEIETFHPTMGIGSDICAVYNHDGRYYVITAHMHTLIKFLTNKDGMFASERFRKILGLT